MPTLSSSQNSQSNTTLLQFTQGVDLDKPLALHEIAVQKAWATGLAEAGYLSAAEVSQVHAALDSALNEMRAGTFVWRIEDEDIHMNLERYMCEKAGELGKKIHLGRSRNDLIATTLRLFVQATGAGLQKQVEQLIGALITRAETDIEIIVPGLTHLQFGQPVRFAQIYLSHAWALQRDLVRLKNAGEMALLTMPLGAAAMSGTHLKIDLAKMAKSLGFKSACQNSYDSVGDRDFMLQSLQSFATVAMHLSRLSEDVIIWASQPYQWVSLPADWSTGSSIMPNKRNPDVPELVRAKSAQVIGAEQSAQLLLKGLVSSYSSDLHELKRVYLQATAQLQESLSVLPEFLRGLKANQKKIAEHLSQGHLLATEVANELTARGKSFREAYKEVAALVVKADAEQKQIHELGFDVSFEQAVEKRSSAGGTAKSSILAQIEQLRSS